MALRPETGASDGEAGGGGEQRGAKVRKVIYIIPGLSKAFPFPAPLPVSHPEDLRLWKPVSSLQKL